MNPASRPAAYTPGIDFRGPINTAIFDWAGTILDFGCMAPVVAFRAAFTQAGMPITEAEARAPMGAAKREHIVMILARPAVQARWQAAKGLASREADVDSLYAAFLKSDEESCARYSGLIPGALDVIAALRARGIAIGSTTGYPRAIMDMLMPLAAAQGYAPDFCATADDVARGRPFPDMVLANAMALHAPDVAAAVVVDDSPSGLVAGRAAGMWAIGIVASGNEVGLSLADWTELDEPARARSRDAARPKLEAAGAHYVIDTVADLTAIIDRIDARLAAGERP